MLDAAAANNVFHQINSLWIEPEVLAQKMTNRLPSDFTISQCLIKLPQKAPPIIQFNDEVSLEATVKLPRPRAFSKGEPLFLHDIEKIETISPPEVNGERVAFIYLFCMGPSIKIVLDASPNLPKISSSEKERNEWDLGELIAESLQIMLTEKVVFAHDKVKHLLQKIGLWAVPALLPYPLSEIAEKLRNDNAEDAKNLLCEYCNYVFLSNLSTKWWSVANFKTRQGLIEDAFFAHKEGKYRLSIHALLPQIEGIITDWIHTQIPANEVPWRQESRTKKFRDLILKDPPSAHVYKRVVESAIDFVLGGPVLKTFKHWFDEIDCAFPNRHVVEHGKYDEALFTEENSIKLFLLLDTIYYIINSHQT